MSAEMLLDMAMDIVPTRDIDPDVSATLSDFLTYTEHLPSSIVRSLTLIQSLNRKSDALQLHIHHLLTEYATLPSKNGDAPDPIELRKEISLAYDKLEQNKRMSMAEATRIEDSVLKDSTRLVLVQKKLKALPMPPSRDPTPELGLSSPQLRRNAQAQHATDKRVAQHRTGSAPRMRSRKVIVPGEVLPPPNPDSPPPSEFSVSPSPQPQSPGEPKIRIKPLGRPPKTPKLLKTPKEPKERAQKTPRVRPPGVTGTNAHSAVAGISTSNALMALTAPPPDALRGSKWLPWKRLTEYEMATLRKRMKKNAIWHPSPAMRNRELKNLGRGVAAWEEAKAAAEESGQPFLDEPGIPDPTRVNLSDLQQAEMDVPPPLEQPDEEYDAALVNRGMRLNEAKKRKREQQKAEEAAQREQEAQSHAPKEQNRKDKSSPEEAPRQAQPTVDTENVPHVETPAQAPVVVEQAAQSSPPPPAPVAKEPSPAPEPPKPKLETKSKKQSKKSEPQAEAAQSKKVVEAKGPANVEPVAQAPAPEPAKKEAAPVEPASNRKRKRDATPAANPRAEPVVESPDELSLPRPAPQPKKIRLNAPVAPPPAPSAPAEKPAIRVSTRAAAASNGPSSPTKVNTPVDPSPRVSTRQQSRRNSSQPEVPAQTPAAPAQSAAQTPAANTRASRSGPLITLKHSSTAKAASAEPPVRRGSQRRASNASLPGSSNKIRSPAPSNATNKAEAKSGKRVRRQGPPSGILATEEDGSKFVVAKPKPPRKPRKNTGAKDPTKEEAAATEEEEFIDPDEPRWCLCNDVSHGTMIGCDNKDCEKEWFHLGCVDLTDLPGRRAKWYCPDCRKKLKLGLTTNGIVR